MTNLTDNFDYLTNLTTKSLERHLENLNAYLEPSRGSQEIGTPELKLIVLTLQDALGAQMSLNAALVEEIQELKARRHGLFKKQ